MSHTSLEIENWKIFNEPEFSYNERVSFHGLNVDAIKFYFYLKEKFGLPNVKYTDISKYFPNKQVSSGNDWCYLFHADTNFILVSGDDLVNISVFSINGPPEEIDFNIFANLLNKVLEKLDISIYYNSSYDIFVNYSFLLYKLIEEYKSKIKQKLPAIPEKLSMRIDEIDSKDSVNQYQRIEYANDYNRWLKATMDRATILLQIQILLPIFYESLIDLAFRIKLQKKYFDFTIKYGYGRYRNTIFKYFERLDLSGKLHEIHEKCFNVDDKKMVAFIQKNNQTKIRSKRNKLLHGNSLYLINLNLKYYYDEGFLIGFPDRHRAERVISESIHSTLQTEDVNEIIVHYETLVKEFVEIFDDNGYFKTLSEGIIFGHNPRNGGALSVGFNKLEDLFLPTKI